MPGSWSRNRREKRPCSTVPERIADYLREEPTGPTKSNNSRPCSSTRAANSFAWKLISQGLVDTILVHPREVFRSAIAANASALVLVHNHPSGDPTPSEADIQVTRDLIRAGQLLKIEVLDHVILGRRASANGQDYVSLRELGYFAV